MARETVWTGPRRLGQVELQRITVDGQRKATIKGFTVTRGSFGGAVNRGATAVIDTNTIQHAAGTGLEVSQNSFARIINNTIQHSGRHGIFVLGSSSVHIGVLYTNDKVPQPNVIQNNRGRWQWPARDSRGGQLGGESCGLCHALIRAAEYYYGTERGVWHPVRDGRLRGRTTRESQWEQWRQGHIGYKLHRSLVSVTRQCAVAVAVQR
jgi:hypothetical protein